MDMVLFKIKEFDIYILHITLGPGDFAYNKLSPKYLTVWSLVNMICNNNHNNNKNNN